MSKKFGCETDTPGMKPADNPSCITSGEPGVDNKPCGTKKPGGGCKPPQSSGGCH